jgi:adenylate kinase family enzyme
MRICLYSGPGAGKSTIAARIFYEFKVKGYSIELVHEYIKKWAYEDRKPKSFDQTYIFGKQTHSEDLVIQSGVKNLVTDSPLLMQVCYAKRYKYPLWHTHLEQAKLFEEKNPALNIFLDRTGLEYQEAGRYEDHSQAIWMDGQITEFMDEHIKDYLTFRTTDIDGILSAVEEKLV